MPVLRDIGEARLAKRNRIPAGRFRTAQHDGAAVRFLQPGDAFDQLGLPVAFDPGDTDDLSAAHAETQPIQGVTVSSALDAQIEHLQHRVARMGGWPIDMQSNIAPHHELGQLFRGRVFGFTRADRLATPNDRDPVADRGDLAQLVRDEDDGMSRFLELQENACRDLRLPAESAARSARPE